MGGTTYYLQNVIFPNQLVSDVPPLQQPDTPPPATNLLPRTAADLSHFDASLRSAILSLPVDLLELFYVLPNLPNSSTPNFWPPLFPIQLLPPAYQDVEAFTTAAYAILLALDPESAVRWHWRDIRKVRRGIDIVWQGRQWSDVTERQVAMKENGSRSVLD